MKIRNQFFCGSDGIVMPSGSRVTPKYGMSFDKELKKPVPAIVGEVEWYAQIQSYREGTELHSIVAMIRNGSIPQSRIDSYIGQLDNSSFIDVSGVPQSFADFSALELSISDRFLSLPADLKRLFGSDVARFRNSVLDGSVNEVLKTYFESKKVPVPAPAPADN